MPVNPTVHDRVNQGPSPTQQNPLSADLQQIMQNLPSMSHPPPPIRNPRSQIPQPQYIAPGGHEVRNSPTTQLNAAYQIGQALHDFKKSPVPQTSPAKHTPLLMNQPPQPVQQAHPSTSPHFPGQMPNPALFHQQKQAVGQPIHPSQGRPVRPALTSSRSAGNIPTVAETLFGEQGLAGTRRVNPLASIFSQQQTDNGKCESCFDDF